MMSLEELLAEEGFKAGRWRSRPSFKFDTSGAQKVEVTSVPPYLHPEHNPYVSASVDRQVRTRRTRSNVTWHGSGLEMKKNERVRSRTSGNVVLEIEKLVVASSEDAQETEIVEETGSNEICEDEKFSVGAFDKLQENSRPKVRKNTESQENMSSNDIGVNEALENESSKDRSSNELLENENLKAKNCNDFQENERDQESSIKELLGDGKCRIRSAQSPPAKRSSDGDYQNNSHSSRNSGDLQNQRRPSLEKIISEPAIDEVAVQAMISILGSYISRFQKDRTFRASLHQNCLSCLSSVELEESYHVDSEVPVNFRHAIEAVERVTEESGNPKELKKASLELSAIAGLNSKDLKDGFTYGILNSHFAACAHLYLSVIFKLQKKNLISAKHLLQVFCDSPYQARMSLLPELWGQLFLPHLSHLRVWYDQEAEVISETSSRLRKMKHLNKVYNEILDSGTYQFAIYYKEWLMKGTEAPIIPSILTPATSICGTSWGDSHEHSPDPEFSKAGFLSSHSIMISEEWYEIASVPRNKLDGADEAKGGVSLDPESRKAGFISSQPVMRRSKGQYEIVPVPSYNLDEADEVKDGAFPGPESAKVRVLSSQQMINNGVKCEIVPTPSNKLDGVNEVVNETSPDPESIKAGFTSSQLMMICEGLYEIIPFSSNKMDESNEVKEGAGNESFRTHLKGLGDISEEVGGGTGAPNAVTCTKQCMQKEPHTDAGEDALFHDAELLLKPENALESHSVDVQDVEKLKEERGNTVCCQSILGRMNMPHLISHMKANELVIKKLARAVFDLQQTKDSPDSIPATMLHSKSMLVPNFYANHSDIKSCTECEFKKIGLRSETLGIDFCVKNCSAGLHENYDHFEESSFFSRIRKEFFCPLSGQLFEDPVTIETGQTYERAAIKEWFDQGNRSCPATGQVLGSITLPATNFIFKRVIDGWKSEHCRNLLVFAIQIAETYTKNECKSKDKAVIFILEQLLAVFSPKDSMENAKCIIAQGGLQFLVRRFELGDLGEKIHAAALLSCCIKADGSCRNYIARNIEKACLIQLLNYKQAQSRTTVVSLLSHLICLNRRTSITSFLRDLQKEGGKNTLNVLIVHLQSSPPDQRPLSAVLLLHLYLLIEPQRYSIYSEEAVQAIIVALDCSLTNEKVRKQSCKALLVLGGRFSYSGDVLTGTWLLKQAGFYDGYDANSLGNDYDNVGNEMDGTMPLEDEEMANEEWLKNMAALLLRNGKKSFLETICNCLSSRHLELVRACLITVAWISHALVALSDVELQLFAFSTLISWLKQNLVNEQIEHRVFASMSLLNFSKVSECRVLLSTFAEEIVVPLHSLSEVTWTAKELHSIISGNHL